MPKGHCGAWMMVANAIRYLGESCSAMGVSFRTVKVRNFCPSLMEFYQPLILKELGSSFSENWKWVFPVSVRNLLLDWKSKGLVKKRTVWCLALVC
ncbi:hypothetical protein CK203_039789 [Vitis vinifera]|uniref:Uncharacterized protein n=1 Tax=Vitis vinifera TaxID=29760 RepID=A0A438HQI7_VITVI|nr:hypothetical protein CK203_039789 [Vitis vinifera]